MLWYLHNIHLTFSGQIPVIITISSNPIQIAIRPRRQFAKGINWPASQQELLTIPTPTANYLSP